MSRTAQNGDTIHVHYRGTLEDGSEFDTSYTKNEPLKFKLGQKEVIEGFEKACVEMKVGDKKDVKIAPAEGYGEYSKELIQVVEKKYFPEDIKLELGQEFMIGGNEFQTMATIIKIEGDSVTIDANPQLAGKTLNFAIELVDIT